MQDRIDFSITGEEFSRVQRFREDHKGCIEKHPNMTGAQFEYCFSEDGLGLFKTVTCVCGESISLTADYDGTVANKPFQVVPANKETVDLVKLTLSLQKRPGMLTGKELERSYKVLHAYLAGRSCYDDLYRELLWRATIRLEKGSDSKEYTDEELYDKFFICFEDVLREEYPIFTAENGILETRDAKLRAEKQNSVQERIFESLGADAVKSVVLNFTNLDSVEFSAARVIDYINITGITKRISTVAAKYSKSQEIAKTCELKITKSGAEMLINAFGGGDPDKVFDRLKSRKDISIIQIKYKSDVSEEIYPAWRGDESANSCQFCVEDRSDGSLTIYIVKNTKNRKRLIREAKEAGHVLYLC